MPRVSVLLPAYNASAYLDAAVGSVLDQTFADFEVLLINDGSTDDTAERIAHWASRDKRIRPIENPQNVGLTQTLNIGLSKAEGDFVARLDADDLCKPDRFETQLAAFDADARLVLVGAQEEVIDAEGRKTRIGRGAVASTPFRWMAAFAPPIVHSSAMFRMEPVRAAGLSYDPTMVTAQDMAFWQTLLRHGDGIRLGQTLVSLRIHDQGISRQRTQRQRDDARRALLTALGEAHADIGRTDLEMVANAVFGRDGSTIDAGRVLSVLLGMEARFHQTHRSDPQARDQIRRHLIGTLLIGATRFSQGGDARTAARLIWAARRCGPKLVSEILAILGRRMPGSPGR